MPTKTSNANLRNRISIMGINYNSNSSSNCNLNRSASVVSTTSTTHSKTTAHDLTQVATIAHEEDSKATLAGSVLEKDTGADLASKAGLDSFNDHKDPYLFRSDSFNEKESEVVYNKDDGGCTKEPIQIFTLTPITKENTSDHHHRHHRRSKQQDELRDSEKGFCDEASLSGSKSPFDLGPLCTWAELPAWMQDNPAILTGYRRETFSYRKSLASLGYLHNESVNIWSHLLGALAFVIISPIAYFRVIGVLDTVQWTDIGVFYAFIAGAIICLSMSASFHTFCCHSEDVSGQWNRCDYVGIVFLIVGSFYPAIFYIFYCHKTWQIMYISLISAFGGATIIVVLQPRFRTPQFRWVRSGLFLALGLSALFPVIHGIILYGFNMAQQAVALNYIFCVGAAYVFGALIYGSRVPECFFPGKFDHFMSSHQIFHICVLIGCAVHFAGISKTMAFWHTTNHSCSIPLAQMQLEFIPA
ncbi:hypothetical protein BG006_008083 [Podila minutissima]|uniref:HlyIII-domain-containing protein n=1 Tax=Podila minutissima TaxID=64525 RepID=A0A9P5SK98_9FUNG|nr:hypothetical protein BG006_008083 [Podila minutissima]